MPEQGTTRRWLYLIIALWLIFLAGVGTVLVLQIGSAQNGAGDGGGNGQAGGDGQQVAGGGGDGGAIYESQCAQCHGPEGEGASGPALAGNQNMQDADAVIQQILQGGGAMPPFADQLSDEEIAAVASHERTSWGNDYGEIDAQQVGQARNGGGGQNGGGQQEGQQQEGQQQEGQQQQNQDTGAEDAGGGQDTAAQADGGGATGGQEGWYTDQQAFLGLQEFGQHCSVCHGGGGVGRAPYPPVVGEEFLAEWQGRSVAELFEYTSTMMPDDRPGRLGHSTYTNIVAFMLQQNGFPAGSRELDPGSGRLQNLIIPAPGQQAGGGNGDGPQQEQTGPQARGDDDPAGDAQNQSDAQ